MNTYGLFELPMNADTIFPLECSNSHDMYTVIILIMALDMPLHLKYGMVRCKCHRKCSRSQDLVLPPGRKEK